MEAREGCRKVKKELMTRFVEKPDELEWFIFKAKGDHHYTLIPKTAISIVKGIFLEIGEFVKPKT